MYHFLQTLYAHIISWFFSIFVLFKHALNMFLLTVVLASKKPNSENLPEANWWGSVRDVQSTSGVLTPLGYECKAFRNFPNFTCPTARDLKMHCPLYKLQCNFVIIWWLESENHWSWASGHCILKALMNISLNLRYHQSCANKHIYTLKKGCNMYRVYATQNVL